MCTSVFDRQAGAAHRSFAWTHPGVQLSTPGDLKSEQLRLVLSSRLGRSDAKKSHNEVQSWRSSS